MMPMTPSGTRTRSMSRPLGRVQRASEAPIGSGSAATASRPRAMPSIRLASSASRSIIEADSLPDTAATSRAFAARIDAESRLMAAAAWVSARFLAAVAARPIVAAAARARAPISAMTASSAGASRRSDVEKATMGRI